MSRKWEEFDDPGTPRIAKLHVSMSPYGTINVSRNAYEALGKPSHVVMLWESDTAAIGLRPVPPETTNAFRLYDSGRSGAHRFHALRFVLKHKISLHYTIRFPTAHIENGVLVLDLNNIARSPRAVRPVPERKGWKVKGHSENVTAREQLPHRLVATPHKDNNHLSSILAFYILVSKIKYLSSSALSEL